MPLLILKELLGIWGGGGGDSPLNQTSPLNKTSTSNKISFLNKILSLNKATKIQLRYPYEHIKILSDKLAESGCRLIYVSLPLKGMIYPEYAVDERFFIKDAPTAPQFRKMTLKLLESKVEVLDFYPIFMQNKDKNLFRFGHNISTSGCELVAKTVANYIKDTSIFEGKTRANFTQKLSYTNNNGETRMCLRSKIYKDDKPYISHNLAGVNRVQELIKAYELLPYKIADTNNDIGIFGDCNLQGFHYKATGIASNLAYYLGQEIDYLGRKLIFENAEDKFDQEAYAECKKHKIVICISFLTGSFVRSSTVESKKEIYKRCKQIVFGNWTSTKITEIFYNGWSDLRL
ncbi:alginate O-acetyltransferase AlgX-related protein [Campylobacter troglodytis]|uniref:alginate O-acetyltransferase AlgX-related protein n=1 Tax=Campylobacter troglodytis TaxID=654363 RepID=UPI00163B7B4C|nr:hypothetical protein [Campylobacter troglodytis]